MNHTKKKIEPLTVVVDVTLVGIIVGVSWLLIGYYLQGEYLSVTYQDWIYHAFRVKSLEIYGGMPSWDHIWSNGLNHWRSYQYLQHLLVFGVAKILHLSFTKAMLFLTVFIFIGVRIAIYSTLRLLRIRPIFAFLATMVSFTYVQQWIAISDFSIFIAFILVPFYVYLWINIFDKYKLHNYASMKDRRIAEYTLALISGALWIFHPVVANALGGLFFISVGFRAIKIHWRYFAELLGVYIVGTLPFFLPYLSMGYRFSNPNFTTAGFMRDTIAGDFFGLSMFFLAFVGATWVMMIFVAKKVPTWSKIIIIYSSLYFLIIFLAQNEYIPAFIMQLQISRVVPILALLIVFAFAGALHGAMNSSKNVSRGAVIVILIISAIAISESIKIGTAFTSQPVHTLDDPVSIYFNDKEVPKGSIYVKEVAAASFFGKEHLRFVTSYNEHLLPHPLSVRFAYFMRSEIAYTGVSTTQLNLINDYVTVLGIEYLVLPEASPLVKNLAQDTQKGASAPFQLMDTVYAKNGAFAILRNKREVYNAYIMDADDEALQWNDNMQTPTIQANSYQKWDESISILAQKIRKGVAQPVDLNFVDTNKLYVNLANVEIVGKKLLITQSYDPYWHINNKKRLIKPSQVRFMSVDLDALSENMVNFQQGKAEIILQNEWPLWHWPVQSVGISLVVSLFVIVLIRPRHFFEYR